MNQSKVRQYPCPQMELSERIWKFFLVCPEWRCYLCCVGQVSDFVNVFAATRRVRRDMASSSQGGHTPVHGIFEAVKLSHSGFLGERGLSTQAMTTKYPLAQPQYSSGQPDFYTMREVSHAARLNYSLVNPFFRLEL